MSIAFLLQWFDTEDDSLTKRKESFRIPLKSLKAATGSPLPAVGGRAVDSSDDESLKRLKAGAGSPAPSAGAE